MCAPVASTGEVLETVPGRPNWESLPPPRPLLDQHQFGRGEVVVPGFLPFYRSRDAGSYLDQKFHLYDGILELCPVGAARLRASVGRVGHVRRLAVIQAERPLGILRQNTG